MKNFKMIDFIRVLLTVGLLIIVSANAHWSVTVSLTLIFIAFEGLSLILKNNL